jgi:hypothetical protein
MDSNWNRGRENWREDEMNEYCQKWHDWSGIVTVTEKGGGKVEEKREQRAGPR